MKSTTAWACPVLLLALAAAVPAADEPRAAGARQASPAGTLLHRTGPDAAWQVGKPQDAVAGRELLALPGLRAEVASKNGAARLVLLGNLPQLSPHPVLESAVVLHDSDKADLDLTLDRGRIAVASTREGEPVRVRVRVREDTWELTLSEKGAEVALELYGRWPRGVPFNPKPRPDEGPTSDLVVLVLKGTADLKIGGRTYGLRAPPGPAYFHGDSVAGPDGGPARRDKLPVWADPAAPKDDEAKTAEQVTERLQKALAEKPIADALALVQKEGERNAHVPATTISHYVVVTSAAALDDLPRVLGALADEKHADLREAAVEALRHWIGRRPGQDLRLYNFLTKEQKYSPLHAEIVLQLLHSPFDEGLPETYEALIAYLRHAQLPVRELARWQLYRLAPAGRDIAYDAAASAEERDRAYKQWKERVPDGKLPPKPAPKKDGK